MPPKKGAAPSGPKGPKQEAPKDPPVEGIEQQEVITDGGHRATPELKSEHRPIGVNDEPIDVQNAGFQRLSALENIAKRSAGITESEYSEEQVFGESDFTETHGPAGVSPGPVVKPAVPAGQQPGEPTPETTPGTVPPATEVTPPAAASVVTPTPATPSPEGMVKIVVDGVEEEITMQEATRRLQIGGTAEKRLQDATEALNRVKVREDRLNVQPGQDPGSHLRVVGKDGAPAGQPAGTSQHQGPGVTIPPEVIKSVDSIIEGLRYGDENEARNAMFGLLRMGGSPGPNQDLSSAVRTELDKTEIDKRFRLPPDKGGFGDIVADPEIYDLLMRRVDRAIAPTTSGGEGKDGLVWETYQEIGNDIRSKYLSGTTFQSKAEEKAGLDPVIPPVVNIAPETTGAPAALPSENPNPQSTIADMARARRVGA